MTERRRDKSGRYIRLCKGGLFSKEGSCSTRAQYALDGYGWSGLKSATLATYCKKHADALAKRLNKRSRSGQGYTVEKVERSA